MCPACGQPLEEIRAGETWMCLTRGCEVERLQRDASGMIHVIGATYLHSPKMRRIIPGYFRYGT